MPILQVTCPECKSKLGSQKGFTAGDVISCPKCETYFEVTAPKAAVPAKPATATAKPIPKKPAPVEDDDEDDDRPVKKRKPVVEDDDDEDDRPRKKKRPAEDDEDDRPRKKKKPVVEVEDDDDEDDDDDRPRKKKKGKKSGSGGYGSSPVRFVILGILLAIMIVLGVMLILKWQNEAKEGRAPSSAPCEWAEMLLSWLCWRRRRKLLAEPFPVEWTAVLTANVPLYIRLTDTERAKLCDDLRVVVNEKHWEGCGGFTITDEVKVTIAAHAALLLLGITHDYFARVSSILVYPSGYRSPEGWMGADGIVRRDTGNLGEAWYDGPVVLAWDAVVCGGQNPRDGQNVVIHEFAHQLDYLDGVADGTPPLRGRERNERWHRVMTAEFERLKAESASGQPKLLDEYGATNPAEFFAVASETFFEQATAMRVRHPDLYAVLVDYYNQDPAAREWGEPRPPAPGGVTPFRGSRAVAKTDAGRQVTLIWPAWVTTLWDLHPGMPREYARRPLGNLWPMAVGTATAAWGWWLYKREWNAPVVLSLLFSAGFVTLAVWLHLAVRWVDRYGVWAGHGTTDPTESLSTPPNKVPSQDP